MRDFLFVLPLLLCISAMIYILVFTLRAAAFVQTDHPQRLPPHGAAGGRFMTPNDYAIVPAGREHALGDEAAI
jgi:hypothetical protein